MIPFEPVGKISYQQFLLSLLGWAIICEFLAIVEPNCPYCSFLGHSIIYIAVVYLFKPVLHNCSGMFFIFIDLKPVTRAAAS